MKSSNSFAVLIGASLVVVGVGVLGWAIFKHQKPEAPQTQIQRLTHNYERGFKIKAPIIKSRARIADGDLPAPLQFVATTIGALPDGRMNSSLEFQDGSHGFELVGRSPQNPKAMVAALREKQEKSIGDLKYIWYTHVEDGLHFEGSVEKWKFLLKTNCATQPCTWSAVAFTAP